MPSKQHVNWQADVTGCQSTNLRRKEDFKSCPLTVVTWTWLNALSVRRIKTDTLLEHTNNLHGSVYVCVCVCVSTDWPPALSRICWCRRWTGWASPARPGREGAAQRWRRRKECDIISGGIEGGMSNIWNASRVTQWSWNILNHGNSLKFTLVHNTT